MSAHHVMGELSVGSVGLSTYSVTSRITDCPTCAVPAKAKLHYGKVTHGTFQAIKIKTGVYSLPSGTVEPTTTTATKCTFSSF